MTESATVLPSKQKIVFVVDDEEVIANNLAIILSNAGFEAHAFFNGQEAVDSLDRLQPDLLITDVVMPQPSLFIRPTCLQRSQPTLSGKSSF
jgi:PleD family two-component response regulator